MDDAVPHADQREDMFARNGGDTLLFSLILGFYNWCYSKFFAVLVYQGRNWKSIPPWYGFYFINLFMCRLRCLVYALLIICVYFGSGLVEQIFELAYITALGLQDYITTDRLWIRCLILPFQIIFFSVLPELYDLTMQWCLLFFYDVAYMYRRTKFQAETLDWNFKKHSNWKEWPTSAIARRIYWLCDQAYMGYRGGQTWQDQLFRATQYDLSWKFPTPQTYEELRNLHRFAHDLINGRTDAEEVILGDVVLRCVDMPGEPRTRQQTASF
ncbi:hypothetical protein F5B20DRAFT_592726 [Whalleya microplaca]|nr:hypothetical protein F5B20DRAFT_592726 [Whalleya microplaca]